MGRPEIWVPAAIGIGSNLDDPVARVRHALTTLATLPRSRLMRASSLYRNPPMGPADQPDYVNAVAVLLTQWPARSLLDRLQALEQAQGRVRAGADRWGARRIDLDILTYGLRQIDDPGLVVPHPGISVRNFVLFPLLEICPHWSIPGRGTVRRLAASLDTAGLEKLPD